VKPFQEKMVESAHAQNTLGAGGVPASRSARQDDLQWRAISALVQCPVWRLDGGADGLYWVDSGWVTMARIGMNPSKTKKSDYAPARVTVAILVHVPYLSGYYEHRLSVLKGSLGSLLANTTVPYDLLVFDNGSGPEAAGYLDDLQRQGVLSFLLRSQRNIGKIGALRLLFDAAPGELVAYADDDFYYFPGWLEAQLRILDTYPNVGMVSGYAVPSFFAPDRTASNTHFAQSDREVTVEGVEALPEIWIQEWAESTGRDPVAALEEERGFSVVRFTYRGVDALGAANHDQFLCRKSVIANCLPGEWSGQLMGQMLELDRAVDAAGYLRLSTPERTTLHIGNVISPTLASRLPGNLEISVGVSAGTRRGSALTTFRKRLLLSRPVRWFLLGIYSHLFRWINPE
jgi:glycosyltransferase involved in cell wall biosynthesis